MKMEDFMENLTKVLKMIPEEEISKLLMDENNNIDDYYFHSDLEIEILKSLGT